MYKFVVLIVVICAVQTHWRTEASLEKIVDYYAPPRYEFQYGVKDAKTGDNKQQVEERKGDVVVGQYSLVEPDGTIRIVKYEADDKNGFNAKVIREGKAIHPESKGW